MTIRALIPADLPDTLALVEAVFMQFEAPDYSDEGIAEFMAYIHTEAMGDRMAAGDLTLFGAFDSHRITGMIATRRGEHISLLFVHPDYHRRGIARQLFKTVLAAFPDTEAVTVNASPYGHAAYMRLGFSDTGPRQSVNGLIFIPMQYRRQAGDIPFV